MPYACALAECTVALAGKCLKLHSPPTDCPHLAIAAPQESTPPLEGPSELAKTRLVYPGHELGLAEATAIMSARYTHLVGVLGEAEAGKTCMLCALYLVASCGQLAPTFRFAGSETLRGYESRLRGYRSWNGPSLPDKITQRTELADPRVPGFLHLGLSKQADQPNVHDLLFSDLPGEWTTSLIAGARGLDRLGFLRRADGIVLTFQSSLLAEKTRHSQLQSARILLQRLRDNLRISLNTPLIVAVTRCDLSGGRVPAAAYEIAATAQDFGFTNVFTIGIAAFSSSPDVPSGLGLGDLLSAVLGEASTPRTTVRRRGSRLYEQYHWRDASP